MSTKKSRVLLGMSGGVDSSVAASLLQKQGYDVIGITMQLLPKENEKRSACCNLDSITDAKRVAGSLGIPHYTLNIRENFQKKVIDHFVDSYLEGYTPNPCVECNRHIKFDELWDKAEELGADYVATGHYCVITKTDDGDYQLKKAKDLNKDQSYFLYMLNSDQLSKILFPLGGFTKPEIREMAKNLDLITAQKKESQDICFVTQGSYRNFIQSQLKDPERVKPGEIVDKEGNVLGTHNGLYHYTIGQRKGLGISNPEPLFVLKLDGLKNRVIVGEKSELEQKTVQLSKLALVDTNESLVGKSVTCKFRYQMAGVEAKVTHQDDTQITLELVTFESQISPGQSGVMYDQDRVIGGGIISE